MTHRLNYSKMQRLHARLARFTKAIQDARRSYVECKGLPLRPLMPLAVVARRLSRQPCNIAYTLEQEENVKKEAVVLRRYLGHYEADLPLLYHKEYYALDDELRTLLRTLADVNVDTVRYSSTP